MPWLEQCSLHGQPSESGTIRDCNCVGMKLLIVLTGGRNLLIGKKQRGFTEFGADAETKSPEYSQRNYIHTINGTPIQPQLRSTEV